MNYLDGILTTAALIVVEHIVAYKALERHVFIKFALGTLAILVGCAVIAYEAQTATPIDLAIVPAICACGAGLALLICYTVRHAVDEAETRGWLKGLADKGDLNGPAGK
jgi:hypothetical protein